ncbi:Ca2+ regulator and membrane fusion protein Fig1-domain-containing protein [Stachybotrys elegans]|uniref:Ca2+ regulator and membrane fusion protein Fig1-domain-containing protein n=1 Tax=Stachybotrys elegans TaxID=80388 RepID=A0A8K0WIT0_9HYPO|nr:Ca2+ regulator and membrane fusion protein Fig1-domain-containing protein [Stachybotrys elegans]
MVQDRFIPFLGYHHLLMILLTIAVILISILIAGCTSESLSDIYLMSLSYANHVQSPDSPESLRNASFAISDLAANHTPLEVRVGYLGMCLLVSGQRICSRSHTVLETFILRMASEDEIGDPLNVIYAANEFRRDVVFVALLFVSIVLALLSILLISTFPAWHEEENSDGSDREVKPFPPRRVSKACFLLLFIASVLSLLTSFWQHLSSAAASSMAEIFTYNNVRGNVGAGAMALGWLSTFLLAVTCVGMLGKILAISVLSQMV